jgi:hypothetical protein
MKLITLLMLLHLTSIRLIAQNRITDSNDTPIKKGLNDTASIQKKDSIPYATLYFYRSYLPANKASLNKAPIYINDSLVYKLKANTLISIQVLKQGKYTVAVDKKGETEIAVSIKFGKEYFFKCSPKQGLVFGNPTIELVTPAVGKAESGILKGEGSKEQ